MEPTVSCVFTLQELWLLQGRIGYEVWMESDWKNPPSSPALNDDIADAILLCTERKLKKAALQRTFHDCLVIDLCVPAWYRSRRGKPIGKRVLVKSFRARRELTNRIPLPDAGEPPDPSREEVVERLRKRE